MQEQNIESVLAVAERRYAQEAEQNKVMGALAGLPEAITKQEWKTRLFGQYSDKLAPSVRQRFFDNLDQSWDDYTEDGADISRNSLHEASSGAVLAALREQVAGLKKTAPGTPPMGTPMGTPVLSAAVLQPGTPVLPFKPADMEPHTVMSTFDLDTGVPPGVTGESTTTRPQSQGDVIRAKGKGKVKGKPTIKPKLVIATSAKYAAMSLEKAYASGDNAGITSFLNTIANEWQAKFNASDELRAQFLNAISDSAERRIAKGKTMNLLSTIRATSNLMKPKPKVIPAKTLSSTIKSAMEMLDGLDESQIEYDDGDIAKADLGIDDEWGDTIPLVGGQPKTRPGGADDPYASDIDDPYASDRAASDRAEPDYLMDLEAVDFREQDDEYQGDEKLPEPDPNIPSIVPRNAPPLREALYRFHRRLRSNPDFGIAPRVSVANSPAFATSWGGLAGRSRSIPLMHGVIEIDGYTAKITVNSRSHGDFTTINTFIKVFFKLGGTLNGKKLTSQGLTRYIMSHAPGKYSIRS